MRRILIVVMVVIALSLGTVVLLKTNVIAPDGPERAADKFVQNIQAGEIAEAYDQLSPEFQKKLLAKDFTAKAKADFKGYEKADLNMSSIKLEDGSLIYTATMVVPDGKTPVKNLYLRMSDSADGWQIGAIKFVI